MVKIKRRLKEIANMEKSTFYAPSTEELREFEKIINAQVENFGLLDPLDVEPAQKFIAQGEEK